MTETENCPNCGVDISWEINEKFLNHSNNLCWDFDIECKCGKILNISIVINAKITTKTSGKI